LAISNEVKDQKQNQNKDQFTKEGDSEWYRHIRKKSYEMEVKRLAAGGEPTEWRERVKLFNARIEKDCREAKKSSDRIMAYLSKPSKYQIEFKKKMKARRLAVDLEFASNVNRINKASEDFKKRFNAKQEQMSKEHQEDTQQFFKEMTAETRDFEKRHHEFEKQFNEIVRTMIDCNSDYLNPLVKVGANLLCSP
jgi:hypothetical protein